MLTWLGRWRGGAGRRAQGRLPALLRSYPPYRLPHPGEAAALTLAQAEANLAFLLANRPARLDCLGELMHSFDLDLRAGLLADDPKPLLDALWQWSAADWPAIYDAALASRSRWLNSTRDGPEIALSLVMDVGIALGEMVIRRRPDYCWALDLDPDNRGVTPDEGMLSWQRPVVLRPADAIVPTIIYDFENVAMGAYERCAKSGYGFENPFARSVLQALAGEHEAAFRRLAQQRPGPGQSGA